MLPSVLRPAPALSDASTTPEQFQAAQTLARVTSPDETPLFICAMPDCNRLFPSRDRVMQHRKRDHNCDSTSNIITWNEE